MATTSIFQLPAVLRGSFTSSNGNAKMEGKTITMDNKVPPPLPTRPAHKSRNASAPPNQQATPKKKSLVDSFTFSIAKKISANETIDVSSSTATKLPTPSSSRSTSLVDTNSILKRPSTNGARFESPVSTPASSRRASSIHQEVTRRPSAFSLMRKKSSLEEQENQGSGRRLDLIGGQSGNSSRQLSARLSYARAASDRTIANPSRKKSENLFTKEEMRSIKLAATAAKGSFEDRHNSDDTSLSSGGDDDPKKRPTLVIPMHNAYEDSSKEKADSFDVANPHFHQDHFGMFIFSGRGSMIFEDDED